MTATITDARSLYEVSSEFRAMLQTWVRERECPVPMIDMLLENGLERQADACRWAIDEPELPVFLPTEDEKRSPCKPYPTGHTTRKLGWYWLRSSGVRSRAHEIPRDRVEDVDSNQLRTVRDALIWLLDHWK